LAPQPQSAPAHLSANEDFIVFGENPKNPQGGRPAIEHHSPSTRPIGRDFSNWVKNQIDSLQLVENEDYVCFAEKGESIEGRGGDRRSIEYHFTLDAAKHIAMATKPNGWPEATSSQPGSQQHMRGRSVPSQAPIGRIDAPLEACTEGDSLPFRRRVEN